MFEAIAFFGICINRIIPGFLMWCEVDVVHPQYQTEPKHVIWFTHVLFAKVRLDSPFRKTRRKRQYPLAWHGAGYRLRFFPLGGNVPGSCVYLFIAVFIVGKRRDMVGVPLTLFEAHSQKDTYVCISSYTHIHIYIYVYVHTDKYNVYIYIYIYTYVLRRILHVALQDVAGNPLDVFSVPELLEQFAYHSKVRKNARVPSEEVSLPVVPRHQPQKSMGVYTLVVAMRRRYIPSICWEWTQSSPFFLEVP